MNQSFEINRAQCQECTQPARTHSSRARVRPCARSPPAPRQVKKESRSGGHLSSAQSDSHIAQVGRRIDTTEAPSPPLPQSHSLGPSGSHASQLTARCKHHITARTPSPLECLGTMHIIPPRLVGLRARHRTRGRERGATPHKHPPSCSRAAAGHGRCPRDAPLSSVGPSSGTPAVGRILIQPSDRSPRRPPPAPQATRSLPRQPPLWAGRCRQRERCSEALTPAGPRSREQAPPALT